MKRNIQQLHFSDAVWKCFAVLWQSGRKGNNGGDEGSWRPSLFLTGDARESHMARFVCEFSASADFTSCLQNLRSFSDMSKRFVKMRVLWELQNHLQTHLPEDGVAPSQGEAIALCILSFPAVYVDATRMLRGGDCVVDLELEYENVLRIEDYGTLFALLAGRKTSNYAYRSRDDK